MSRKGAPGALAARPTEQEQDKGRVDQTRVKRYWAGKAPEWASAEQQIQELQLGGAEAAGREVVRTEVAAPVIVQRKADPRLARLAATRSEDLERMREEHREIRAAEVVRRRRRSEEDEQPSSEEPEQRRRQDEEEEEEEEEQQPQQQAQQQEQEEDEEEADRRRQAVRERCVLGACVLGTSRAQPSACVCADTGVGQAPCPLLRRGPSALRALAQVAGAAARPGGGTAARGGRGGGRGAARWRARRGVAVARASLGCVGAGQRAGSPTAVEGARHASVCRRTSQSTRRTLRTRAGHASCSSPSLCPSKRERCEGGAWVADT